MKLVLSNHIKKWSFNRGGLIIEVKCMAYPLESVGVLSSVELVVSVLSASTGVLRASGKITAIRHLEPCLHAC